MTELGLLEQANAALRLGDWFVPPVGSVFVSPDYGVSHYRVVSSRLIEDLGRADTFFGEAVDSHTLPGWSFARIQMAPHHTFTLLELPDGCPPFSHWRRPTK